MSAKAATVPAVQKPAKIPVGARELGSALSAILAASEAISSRNGFCSPGFDCSASVIKRCSNCGCRRSICFAEARRFKRIHGTTKPRAIAATSATNKAKRAPSRLVSENASELVNNTAPMVPKNATAAAIAKPCAITNDWSRLWTLTKYPFN